MTVTDIHPDDAALRKVRRERVLAEMQDAGVDILITGRESNARYIAGVPRLWLAGSRPFGPGCVLSRETGEIHLVSTWDEGVPEDIPHENLHGITFNGQNTLAWLSKVAGAASAKKVATDGLMPSSAKLIQSAFPAADLVDGEELMRRVRRLKLPEEISAIRTSVRLAEHALEAAETAFTVGITERQLTARFMEAMAAAGITTPTSQDVAWVTSRQDSWSRSHRDNAVAAGDLVAFDGGLICDGYYGELGRTMSLGAAEAGTALKQRWDELWDRLLSACRPGATGSDLLAAYDAIGVAVPPLPVARGLGLGNDLPLITAQLPQTAAAQKIEPGVVLALTAYLWQEGVGAIYGQEPVVITDSGPSLLSVNPFRDSRSSIK